MYFTFYDRIFADGKRLTAGSESLLLRGCILRNTDYVQGIVLYAGKCLSFCVWGFTDRITAMHYVTV